MAAFKASIISCNSARLATLLLALVLHLPARTTALEVSTNILLQGQALLRGSQLVQPPYIFIVQRDCNLVLYHVLWSSETPDTVFENCVFLLQGDGNGVIYNWLQEPVFATDTWGRNDGKHVITLRSDGNVVMTNENGEEIRATHTAGR